MTFNNKKPFNNMPKFNNPCNKGPCIKTTSANLNKTVIDNRFNKPVFYKGYGGAKCSQSDVIIGTFQSNNLGEGPKSGGSVGNMLGGLIGDKGWKFECSAGNITGKYKK